MKKKAAICLLVFAVSTIGISGCGIKQTKNSVTVEAGQELALEATDFFDISKERASEVTFDTSNVDIARPGEYKVTALYKKESYVITVKVEDTTAPAVEMKERILFTNDVAAADVMELVDSVYDASEYTIAFSRFEKSRDLSELDEAAVEQLKEEIPVPCEQEKLAQLGTEEIPTEEGIYHAVVAVTDASGNVQLEEVCIVLDKTAALIEDVEDKTVEQEDVTVEPEIQKEDYVIKDNVDGIIPPENIQTELKLTDEEKYQYTITVSYTDRAGNESKADFIINVTEKQKEHESESTADAGNDNGSGGSNNSNDSGNDGGNGNDSNGEGGGSGGSSASTGNDGNSGEENTSIGETTADRNDAILEAAGFYNIVALEGGAYAVIVNGPEEGDMGIQMLTDYVAAMGYDWRDGGGNWFDSSRNMYVVFVSDLYIPDEEYTG